MPELLLNILGTRINTLLFLFMSQFEILSLLTSFCVTVLNCKVRRIKVATSWDYWEDSINLSMPIFSTVPGTFSDVWQPLLWSSVGISKTHVNGTQADLTRRIFRAKERPKMRLQRRRSAHALSSHSPGESLIPLKDQILPLLNGNSTDTAGPHLRLPTAFHIQIDISQLINLFNGCLGGSV